MCRTLVSIFFFTTTQQLISKLYLLFSFLRMFSLFPPIMDHHQSETQPFQNKPCTVVQFQYETEDWGRSFEFTVQWTLSCQNIKESLIPQDMTLNKCTNTWTPVRHCVSVGNSSACCIWKQFPFTHFPSDIPLSLRCLTHSLSLCRFWFFQYWMFFLLVSLLSLYSVTLFPSMSAISANLLSRSRRLFLCFSLPSITLMNSDGGSRVMADGVLASASSPFWQIAPINLIYHYFPSSFNKFLWASPPLMTRCLR